MFKGVRVLVVVASTGMWVLAGCVIRLLIVLLLADTIRNAKSICAESEMNDWSVMNVNEGVSEERVNWI